jgi:ribonuclease HI
VSFQINVVVIDVASSWGILLSKDLVGNLGGSFQFEGSKVVIPHLEGGFITLHKEPVTKCLVEPYEEFVDQLFCMNNGMENLLVLDPEFEEEPCQEYDGMWTIYFDGAHSNFVSGAGIVLTSPSRETFYFSYRLEYHCKNNVVEYEALIIGFNLAIDRKIKYLRVIGDSDLVVSQVLLNFSTKNERLKRYQDLARDIAKHFEVISIEAVPKEENHVV